MRNRTKNQFYSPLRYPGGKTKLAPFVKSLIDNNGLTGINYTELYAGGAGVALSLLMEEYVSTITINDFDRSIYAFWHSVIDENERLCKKILKAKIDISTWTKQKKIQENKDKADLFSLGFSTFYLNRTNVSGVIKGGVIGGKKQLGKYKMDARFNKEKLIKRIEKIGTYNKKIKVKNEKAIDILKKKPKGLLYLDPPYVNNAKDLYMNFYTEQDHKKIADILLSPEKQNCVWILSYDCDDLISRLYKRSKHKILWDLQYGASNTKSKEQIFFHPDLQFHQSERMLTNN